MNYYKWLTNLVLALIQFVISSFRFFWTISFSMDGWNTSWAITTGLSFSWLKRLICSSLELDSTQIAIISDNDKSSPDIVWSEMVWVSVLSNHASISSNIWVYSTKDFWLSPNSISFLLVDLSRDSRRCRKSEIWNTISLN